MEGLGSRKVPRAKAGYTLIGKCNITFVAKHTPFWLVIKYCPQYVKGDVRAQALCYGLSEVLL